MLYPDENNETNGRAPSAPLPVWSSAQDEASTQSDPLGHRPEPVRVPSQTLPPYASPYERIPYQPVQPVPSPFSAAGEPTESYPPHPDAYQAAQWPFVDTDGHAPAFASQPGMRPSYPGNQPVNRRQGSGLRTGAIIALTLVILLVFGVGLFAGWRYGQSTASTATVLPSLQTSSNTHTTIPPLTGSNLDTVREAVVANVKPAIVEVKVGDTLGSGVIIDKRGYIVTNNHVVAGDTSGGNGGFGGNGGQASIDVVLADGTTQSNVQLVGTDPADDLAVLKINPPANITTVTLGDSSGLQVGQTVLAIGNPLGITQTVTSGIISALNRNVNEQNGAAIQNAIQTDAPINPGNSGGALVDLQGHLVGIPTLTAVDPEFNTPASGVGFAIPSNRVQFIVNQIITSGKVTHTGRAELGIGAEDVDANVAAMDNLSVSQGVLIAQLVNNGPAARAGLQVNDVIVQIDGAPIDNTSALVDALMTRSPGQKVQVKVYRGNQQITVAVTLSELQASN